MRKLAAVMAASVILWAAMPVTARSVEPSVSAVSAVLFEPESGRILWEKDARTPRPMASTTKLMTALLAAERLGMDATVRVPPGAVPVEGTQIGLTAGDAVTVRDLVTALLLASGNDAANALAILTAGDIPAFAALMNEKAAALGMTDSHFVTPSGLDGEEHAASARDMALLAAAVLRVPLLSEIAAMPTATVTVGGRRMTLKNHNKLLSLCDGCVGLKTGFTKKAGRCLVSAAVRGGVTLIAVTLHAPDDWNDHIAMYNAAFPTVRRESLPPPSVREIPVAGGTAKTVPVSAKELPSAVLFAGETVAVRTELPRFLWAPIAAGDPVGRVTYLAGERVLCTLPLTAGERADARKVPTGFERWVRHLRQLTVALFG